MTKDRGFSLIELLIVIAVILIIAAIGIPNLIRARIAANESATVSAIRTIMTAEAAYNTSYPNVGYSADLVSLGGSPPCTPTSTNACLIDTVLASGTKSGYFFNAAGGNANSSGAFTTFGIGAAPSAPGVSGVRRFCGLNDNVIHYDLNAGLSGTIPNASDCDNAPFAGQIIQ
ncbi:MAG: prepilin-type N-terminal cleavage/methylation domain-containing protein [Chlamydiota bacterium]